MLYNSVLFQGLPNRLLRLTNEERTSQFLGQMKEAQSLTEVSQDLAAAASTLKTQGARTLNDSPGGTL